MKHAFKSAILGLSAVLALSSAAVAQPAPLTKVPAEVRAGTYKIEPSHSKVTWSVTHFGYSTYVGQFTGVAGTVTLDPKAPAATDLSVTIDTASVGTLNPALDTHLKGPDFLDVAKFPTATFKAKGFKSTGALTADVAGELTLHGVTKPVVLHVTFNQAGDSPVSKRYTLGFAAAATIKRSEFGIPKYAPFLSDEVALSFAAELNPAS